MPKLTAFCQDSTRLVKIQAWQAYRLIHDAQSYYKCQTALDSAEVLITEGNKLLVKANEGIELLTVNSQVQTALISNLRAQLETDKEIHHEKEKGLKGVIKRLWLFVIGEGLIIVFLLL